MLFRWKDTEGTRRRVDILFTDVRFVETGCIVDSITIEQIDTQTIASKLENLGEAREPGLVTYRILSKSFLGYVVCGKVYWHEDEKALHEPSAIYKPGLLMKHLAQNGYSPE